MNTLSFYQLRFFQFLTIQIQMMKQKQMDHLEVNDV